MTPHLPNHLAFIPTGGGTPDPPQHPDADEINLRLWFICFLSWLGGLTAAASWGMWEIDQTGSRLGWAVWILSLTAFYLSLCCAFIPLPTTWIILLAASDMVAQQIGVTGHAVERLVVVSTVCAAATALANLNEYHIVLYLLQIRRIAKVRQTRLYVAANRWFRRSPFWIVMLFSFLPIPVDVIRWLAIFSRYPRAPFFLANLIGRWFRYAIWALASLGLGLTTRHIIIIQIVLVALALTRILLRWLRRNHGHAAPARATGLATVGAPTAESVESPR